MENSLCKPDDRTSKVFGYSGANIVLCVSTLTTNIGAAYASSNDKRDEGNSIAGNYADGYELGKENVCDVYRSGNSKVRGYKIGYEIGWAAAKVLGD
jgi:hypothetical protein